VEILDKRLIYVAFCAGVVLIPAVALAQNAPTTPVPTATLTQATWRNTIELAATVDAEQDATLAAERGGLVTAVLFHSGQSVPEGAVLVQFDDAPERAQLALDQARLVQAGRDAAREGKLITISGASQSALEQAQAAQAEAKAQVLLDQANIAQLQVTAPFAGIVGIRKISAGDYVQQGAAVASITQTAPLRVLFSVPQTEAGGLAIGDTFTLTAPALARNAVAAGNISALSPMVDAATNARDAEGTITDNTAGLLPGMIGTITLTTGAPVPALLVPNTALNDSVIGRFIFVLQPAGKGVYTLHTVYVTPYGEVGNNTAVAASGLQAGEQVVAIGGFKLTDGASVTIEGQ
jgi:RND family efflux transporter MFP subunit